MPSRVLPALIVEGRWAKGVGTTGIVADDAHHAVLALEMSRREVAALESTNADLVSERAELWNLLDVETRPN